MGEKQLKILLIEDNPADVRLIKEYLNESDINYKLTITDRVSDALIKMRKQHDIILTDLGLPDSNGLDSLKKLKETGTQVPIVILTGLDNKEYALISIQEGAQEYLSKNNLDSDSLSKSIKSRVEQKTMEEK